jgi:mRNA interferase MazF
LLPYSRGAVVVIQLDKESGLNGDPRRTCVVVQNDVGNNESPVTIVVPLRPSVRFLSGTLVQVTSGAAGFPLDGVIDCGQITMIHGSRIVSVKGHLDADTMSAVDTALRVALGL